MISFIFDQKLLIEDDIVSVPDSWQLETRMSIPS
eukprot:SAG31_NODE_55_length_29938_cov_9.154027_3_plen_34_part_00